MTVEAKKAYNKPLPQIEPEAKEYWESLKAHVLKVQHCADCGRWFFPPRTICPGCMSENVPWTAVSGRGKVWGVTNFHHAFHPGYKDEIPYNLSVVELEEGARMVTNVIGCPVEDVKIGMDVEVFYDDVTDEFTLAKFKPV